MSFLLSMKMIPLTHQQFALVDDEDFEWLMQYKWSLHRPKHYAQNGCRGRKPFLVFMHRMILNAPKGVQVDHRDRNGLNNQRSNLRLCTRSENGYNRAANRNSKSGSKGVIQLPSGLWTARISIGIFTTREEASAAYDAAAKQFHGEFAYDGANE
jgi:hypothetical protein